MARPIATFMNAAIDLPYSRVWNVAIGPPLKYIYIYIYLARPIATFMNAAIDLPYSRVWNVAIGPPLKRKKKKKFVFTSAEPIRWGFFFFYVSL